MDNDLDRSIVYGIGDDEICALFGYLYPPSAQAIGYVTGDPNPDGSSRRCSVFDLGQLRKSLRGDAAVQWLCGLGGQAGDESDGGGALRDGGQRRLEPPPSHHCLAGKAAGATG